MLGDVLWHSDVDGSWIPTIRPRPGHLHRAWTRALGVAGQDFGSPRHPALRRADRPYVSPNFKGTVHGIPAGHRETDAEGHVYPGRSSRTPAATSSTGHGRPFPLTRTMTARVSGTSPGSTSSARSATIAASGRPSTDPLQPARRGHRRPQRDVRQAVVGGDGPRHRGGGADAQGARSVALPPQAHHVARADAPARGPHERVPESIRRWHARTR